MFRVFDYLADIFTNPHTETDKQTPKRMDGHIQIHTPSGGGNNYVQYMHMRSTLECKEAKNVLKDL